MQNKTSRLAEQDFHFFNEGTHFRLYEKMGARLERRDGVPGCSFAVWAPDAKKVFVMGDFNNWQKESHPLTPCSSSGIWETFVPHVEKGSSYKYYIVSRSGGYCVEKADPFGFYHEISPRTGSVVWDLEYSWNDKSWMRERHKANRLDAPLSIYEIHFGSWKRVPEEGSRFLTYREMAPLVAAYVKKMGFTHVELMPIMEHPFYGSWGYQITGYFAPTSRYGTPQDFMYFVDHLHQNNIGVILDWVPSHFANDQHGLGFFDGAHLYEHADPRQGFHPDWNSFIFNYGRNEVISFLISNAIFWLDKYHIDGLRADAVASMLYLDYSRKNGEWIQNEHGGNENLKAIHVLCRLNEEVYKCYPDVQTFAEESTAWAMVSRPTSMGGLGFGLKWDMGWMHDTLRYLERDSVHRRYHHNELSFRMMYAFNENFVLPLSHDEVVHQKGSLLSKMPGTIWQKFANLRLLFGYMYGQPGKKLLFMGGEFAQWSEWWHESSLDWHLLDHASHAGITKWVEDLNKAYRQYPALHDLDCSPEGFEWIDYGDADNSVLCFLRKSKTGDQAAIVCNFTPVPRFHYKIGVPSGGLWKEMLNSDAAIYGGSNLGNLGEVIASPLSWHGCPFSLDLLLPPLSALFFYTKKN